jgi:hypothetical protein
MQTQESAILNNAGLHQNPLQRKKKRTTEVEQVYILRTHTIVPAAPNLQTKIP